MNQRDELIAAMDAAGLSAVKPLKLIDGRLERFRVVGDKAGSRNGWAVLNTDPTPFGAFGSWRTGESHTWKGVTNEQMTAAQRAEHRRQVEALRAARAADEAQTHAEAAARAVKLWNGAKPATNDHPYLRSKGVHAFGLRALRDQIMVPARDTAGTLHTLQFISPDGTKRFLTGGRIRGCYCPIGRPDDALLLAEGYATAATLHQATGHAVAVCFNCGNLLAVARALRAKYPRLQLVVCADDDRATPGNPGLTAARTAAAAVAGVVAVPDFSGVCHG